ncbi:MAG TPA: 3-deoxy-manno-octulosonate cytidylyltransferase [bacterium]|nr:3-deoxy-manno-octulosonate cytidylyltransferase [bacterium]
MRVVGVIPARYGSTRLPGKPLKKIGSKTLIDHVYFNAKKANILDDLIVATDHEEIFEEVKKFGGQAKMTSTSHNSGSDRIAEVIKNIDCDYVVNVQGDEPFIKPSDIDRMVENVISNGCKIGSLACSRISQDEFNDPNIVKVILDANGYAIYFSRHSIPYLRDREKIQEDEIPALKHIGAYVYTREMLLEFTSMAPSALEKMEKLEQLRLLEAGYKIYITKTDHDSPGIDTPEDLKLAEGEL